MDVHTRKLIIFDWDGTLIDSIAKIVSSVQLSARALGLVEPCEQQAKAIIGLSLPNAMQTLFPKSSSGVISALVEQYKLHYQQLNHEPCVLFDGVTTLLSQLREQDKILAVATGKARVSLENVWQQTNTKHFFDGSSCGDEYRSKPDPQMLEDLLKRFKLNPSDAVMIGDSHLDINMAKAAGISSIGITHGAADYHQMQSYQPDKFVSSIAELSKLLFAQAG